MRMLLIASIICATGALLLTLALPTRAPSLLLSVEREGALERSGRQGRAAQDELGTGPSGGRATAHREGGRVEPSEQRLAPEVRKYST